MPNEHQLGRQPDGHTALTSAERQPSLLVARPLSRPWAGAWPAARRQTSREGSCGEAGRSAGTMQSPQ